MDKFFIRMKSTLKDIEISNSVSETYDFTGILQRYFPNLFAERLVPINLLKWPSYAAGSVLLSDMPDFSDKIKTSIENLIIAKKYFEISRIDI